MSDRGSGPPPRPPTEEPLAAPDLRNPLDGHDQGAQMQIDPLCAAFEDGFDIRGEFRVQQKSALYVSMVNSASGTPSWSLRHSLTGVTTSRGPRIFELL